MDDIPSFLSGFFFGIVFVIAILGAARMLGEPRGETRTKGMESE